jgi:hypothetical protein
VGSEPKSPTSGDLAVGNHEVVTAYSRHHSQPLRLVAVHQVNDHIVPVMILDFYHGFGVAGAIRIGMAAEDETAGRQDENREAQEERELNLIPAESISTP